MRRVFALAALAVALVGCGDSTGPTSITGTWNLQSINNQSVPYTVFEINTGTPYKFEITGMNVDVNSGGSFTLTTNYRTTQGTSVETSSDVTTGTWSQSGSTITFTDSSDPSSTSTATVTGDVMTITETDTDPDTGATVTLTFKFTHS